MSEAVFISKNNVPADLNFEELRQKGIETIQQISGKVWTDFNVHDPGVTILEQLCYAITELGYRTHMPLETLLASQLNANHVRDTFFTAADILTTGAITVSDMRKVLIDRVTGLRNVWIDPINLSSEASQIRGLYMVMAEASPEVIRSDADRAQMEQSLRSELRSLTNLGESFDNLTILKPLKVYVKADMELAPDGNVEHIHAEALFHLSRGMTRPLKFHSLEEMINSGTPVNDMFDGPRLLNGFVKDGDLSKKVSFLNASQFITILNEIKGVKAVKSLNLFTLRPDGTLGNPVSRLSGNEVRNVVFVGMSMTPVLGNSMNGAESDGLIRYFRHNVQLEYSKEKANKHYLNILSKELVAYSKSFQTFNDLPTPTGKARDITNYTSIQHHFPAIYGLGPRGIPPNLPNQQKSLAYQLKGYLIGFEQIMANYLQQLGRFSELFSLDPSLTHTYFSGSVQSIPYLKNLLSTGDPEQYQQHIQVLLGLIDDFSDRRIAFLDHVLARFGEKFGGLRLQNTYYYADKEQSEQNIRTRINLLAKLPHLSANRSLSLDPSKPYWETDNMAIAALKVRILLDLPGKNIRIGHVLPKHINLSDPPERFNFRETLSLHDGESFLPLKEPIITLEDTPIADKIYAKDMRSFQIDRGVFESAVYPENLAVIRHEKKKKAYRLFVKVEGIDDYDEVSLNIMRGLCDRFFSGKKSYYPAIWWHAAPNVDYVLQFDKISTDPEKKEANIPFAVWKQIGKYTTEEEAFEAGSKLVGYIRKQHLKCEGFHLVDHIWLRPKRTDNIYGIHFIHPEHNISFKSSALVSYDQVEMAALKSIPELKEADPVVVHVGQALRLHLQKNGKDLGYSTYSFTTVDEAMSHYKSILKPYFNNFNELDLYNNQRVSYLKVYQENTGINGNNYSFRVTVVLPGWTARFSDVEFRSTVEQLFRLEVPAHIAVNFLWMDYDEMQAFEDLYEEWLTAHQNDIPDRMNALSSQLMDEFLLKMKLTPLKLM